MPLQQNGNEKYAIYRESEHQELWYPDVDLTKPVQVHIPSALGLLGYFVCVRVPGKWADKLGDVTVKAKIGGLRPDDLHLKAGEGVTVEDRVPSLEKGFVWRLLCRAYMSRGDGQLSFLNWPRKLGKTDLLLCTWPRYLVSGQADDWLECQDDPLWTPTGIPLGGIGGGRIDLCRDGRFRNFSGNNNQDMPLEDPAGLPMAFLAVEQGDELHTLTSSQMAIGDFDCCRMLEFTGRFPQAELSAVDCLPGVDVTVVASGTLCPHNLRWSSIPGLLLRWHVTNTTKVEQKVVCLFNWPNVIGYGGGIAQEETDTGKGDGTYCYWEDTDGAIESKVQTDLYDGVLFRGTDKPNRLNSSGRHILAVKRVQDADSGAKGSAGEGYVWQEVTVPAGGTETVDMALVWAMPHWVDTKGGNRGHYWQNHFAGAEEMAAELLKHSDEILKQAGSLADLLEKTDLPDWLKSRLSNCNYPLVSNSVWVKDGRFSINEGPTEMSGVYGTIDQRLGAHFATQALFPELNAKELREFAAVQAENGDINHDLGAGHLESPARGQRWPDIQCSFVIQTARHAWTTGDKAFEAEMWPKARKALLRTAIWAEEGGGVAQVGHKSGLGTSYDGYHYEGTTPYVGTLWLAALAVAEKWARRLNDAEIIPQIEKWRAAAIDRMEKDLWNGSFYWTYNSAQGPKRETAFAGMLAGQVYTRMLTGTNVLPDDRLLPSVDALMKLNGSAKFGVPPDEVTPAGESAVEFGWLPYVEAFGLTAAATARDPRVLPLWERMMAAVDQNGTRLCDTRLMYRPQSGEPSWGAFYMTAPASWLVYDSLLDFFYSPDDALLRLNPQFAGKMAVVHPLWWGIAEARDGKITLRIERVFTDQPLAIAAVEVLQKTGGYRKMALPQQVAIKAGSVVSW